MPSRPVDMIELEDEVQEFETYQDAGMRQVLSVQVDVSDVRFFDPPHVLVLAMEFHGCWTKEGSPRCHRHYSPPHSSRQSLGPCIPSDLYPKRQWARHQRGARVRRVPFWERRPVDIHRTWDSLADHTLLLSFCVVESPVLSLLIGRDVVEGLGSEHRKHQQNFVVQRSLLNRLKTRQLDIIV